MLYKIDNKTTIEASGVRLTERGDAVFYIYKNVGYYSQTEVIIGIVKANTWKQIEGVDE